MLITKNKAIIVIVTAIIMVVGVWQVKALTAPAIHFDNVRRDLGVLGRGSMARASFHYSYTGLRLPNLAIVNRSCACTATVMRSVDGERGAVVELVVNTENLPEGPQEKYVTFSTNDPRQEYVTLSLNFSVASEFIVSAGILDFGVIAAGTKSRKVFSVRPNAGSEVTVVDAYVDKKGGFKIGRLLKGGGGSLELEVETSTMPIGSHFGTLIVRTSSRLSPDIRVPILAHVE